MSSLENKINKDLLAAMKIKDRSALRGIRAIKAAILLAKTDGSNEAIDESKEIKILQKLVKQRKDSLQIYEKQDREDLAVIEREEIEIISLYLPQQMTVDKIKAVIADIISESGASGMKDMGRVMRMVSKSIGGRADNKIVAGIVKESLF